MNVTVRSDYLGKWHRPVLADIYELLYATANLEIRTGCGVEMRLGTVTDLNAAAIADRCVKCYGVPA